MQLGNFDSRCVQSHGSSVLGFVVKIINKQVTYIQFEYKVNSHGKILQANCFVRSDFFEKKRRLSRRKVP